MAYRWLAAHRIEGLCGPNHKLSRDGCATCGPTVRLSPSAARPHLDAGHLVAVIAEEKPSGMAPADIDQLIRDAERQSKANAALQAEVAELRLQRDLAIQTIEEQGAEMDAMAQRIQGLEAQLADREEGAPVQPLADVLDELTNAKLVELAEAVRVDRADDEAKAFTGRAERRARIYLDVAAPDVVRRILASL